MCALGRAGACVHEEIDAKFRLYNDVANSVPRGEVRPVEAGHVTIHRRGEDAVVSALQELVTGPDASNRGVADIGSRPA